MAMNTNTANIYIKATDQTKQAFDNVSSRIKSLALLGGVAGLGIMAITKAFTLANESFQKFADLNDITDNFDISTEKALAFTDAMGLVGMSAEETKKSFSDLSTNITKAFTDEKLRMTFNQLGVTLKDLKTGNVGDIFQKILNSTAGTADKAKQLTLLKDVFGKQGLKILDASQDERVKDIIANAERLKEVIRATSFVADEFDKTLKLAGNTIKNEVAMAFAPVLPAITAFVESLFSVNDELEKTNQLLDFIETAETFKVLIEDAFDFADIITATFVKFGEIVYGISAVGGGLFLKLVGLANLLGDTIFGALTGAIKGAMSSLGDLSSALFKLIKGDFEGAKIDVSKALDFSQGFDNYKAQIKKNLATIDFGGDMQFTGWESMTANLKLGRFEAQKMRFAKAFNNQIKGIVEAAGKDGTGAGAGGRTGFDPMNVSGMVNDLVKQLETQLKLGKDNLDYLQKYNETQYNAQFKDVEEYYKNKRDLMETDYAFQLDMVDKQIALLQKAIPAVAKPEEKVKLEQQVNDLLVKRNKIEKDYEIGVIDFNAKEIKDKMQLNELINSRYDTEIEKINIKRELIGLTAEDESNILKLQQLKISNYEKEIELLLKGKDIAKLTEQDQKTKADLELKIGQAREVIDKKAYQDKLDQFIIGSQLKDLEVERIKFEIENGAGLFANNLKIKTLKEEQIKLLEGEIALLDKKANKDQKDILAINQKKLEVDKLKQSTDDVALSINNTVGKGFETLFSDVLSGTKSIEDSFKDMANSIVGTINSMIAQDLGKALYRSIFPDDRNQGGLGGFVSNLFGSGSTGGLFDKLGGFISGAFAGGGYAQAGNAYLVGEKGPELFYPGQSGYVMSNKNSQNMVGGNSVVNVTIQAKDYQSFRNSETQVAQQLQRALTRGSRNN